MNINTHIKSYPFAALLVVMALLLLTGCGSSSSQPAAAPKTVTVTVVPTPEPTVEPTPVAQPTQAPEPQLNPGLTLAKDVQGSHWWILRSVDAKQIISTGRAACGAYSRGVTFNQLVHATAGVYHSVNLSEWFVRTITEDMCPEYLGELS